MVPEHLEYPNVTLYERLMQTVEKYPDAIAWQFSIGNMSQTYKQLAADIDKFADGLSAAGFKKGDMMTSFTPMCLRAVFPFAAEKKVGEAASIIPPFIPPRKKKFYQTRKKKI